MKILLTNDDGVFAPGIRALHAALIDAGHEVFVAAPETEQSAVGHSITLAEPIRVRRLNGSGGMEGYGIKGTPADCVKLAMNQLVPWKPDLVVSGINQGANVGNNVLYSGTVSAASEAAIMGLHAMAISFDSHANRDFSVAADVAARLVGCFFQLDISAGMVLNANLPDLSMDEIKGFRWCGQSSARFVENFIERTDPRGNTYYWQAGETMDGNGGDDNDFALLRDGYITLTPLGHKLALSERITRMPTAPLPSLG